MTSYYIYVSVTIFCGPVILPCISDLILQKDIFKIPYQSDIVNDLIHFVGHCNLYFMVPLIC